ncbi:MAG: hypothetical protein ABIG61_04210 [Planctomycetota bacterium]
MPVARKYFIPQRHSAFTYHKSDADLLTVRTMITAIDKADREAIVESLREVLKRGDKSLIGNKGYRRC